MKIRFAILPIVMLFCGMFSCQNTEQDDQAILRQIKEVEWPKAYMEQDTTLLDNLLADNFQMIDATGNWYRKQDEIAFIKANKPSHKSFRFRTKRLDIIDNHTAVIAGIGTTEGQDMQGLYVNTYHSTDVFIKKDGKWKAVSSHVSGMNTQRAR